MPQRLTRSGNSLALVIDRPLLEALEIDADTELKPVGSRAQPEIDIDPVVGPRNDRLFFLRAQLEIPTCRRASEDASSTALTEGELLHQGAKALWAHEMAFFVQRGLTHLVMGGVFERFRKLREEREGLATTVRIGAGTTACSRYAPGLAVERRPP